MGGSFLSLLGVGSRESGLAPLPTPSPAGGEGFTALLSGLGVQLPIHAGHRYVRPLPPCGGWLGRGGKEVGLQPSLKQPLQTAKSPQQTAATHHPQSKSTTPPRYPACK